MPSRSEAGHVDMTDTFSLDWYRGRKVLVTGGAGFIGSHLVNALVMQGAKVSVLDNLAHGCLDNLSDTRAAVVLYCNDLSDGDALQTAMRDTEIVFHLAANASVPRSVQQPTYDFRCNALGTLNLLDVARTTKPARCVVASSAAVYGQPSSFPIVEDSPLQPISPYGASKLSTEGLCCAFHASYDLPLTIARIFNTYGPRQPRFVMYDMYRKLRADPSRLEILGDGKQVRDYCFVADTVDALLRLGTLDAANCTAYNIASGCSHTVLDVASLLCELMGLTDVQQSFTGHSWPGDARRWEVSIAKLRQATGYQPCYDLKSGLECFVAWFNAHPERIQPQ